MTTDIKAAHRELTSRVMGKKGVSGTAIGQDKGAPCLKVYTTGSGDAPSVPASIGGFPVVIETSGGFRRL